MIFLLLTIGFTGCQDTFQTEKETSDEKQEPETGFEWFQIGNNKSINQIITKESKELIDNRIGDFPELNQLDFRYEQLLNTGYKWQKIELLKDGKYNGTFWEVDWHNEEYSIDSEDDNGVTELVKSGVSLIACLGCLVDESGFTEHGRFKTEEDIQLYLSYVRKIVRHYKNRIQYYEIWNEPDVQTPNWYIELQDYINLINRTIPIILEEYPEAKIVVGSTTPPDNPRSKNYLFGVLQSGIMPLVDVISWHPMFGTSPEYDCCREYYYNYTSIVQEIKDVASAHGFEGEYYAGEINWIFPEHPLPPVEGQPRYNKTVCAKYYARGILMHLGMDIIAGIISWGDNPKEEHVVQKLCTIMAGAKPIELTLDIQSDATNIRNYSFSLPNDDRLVALWTDGIAVVDDPGSNATVVINGVTSDEIIGIDILEGYEQPLLTTNENGNLTISNLLVRDYPIIMKIIKSY